MIQLQDRKGSIIDPLDIRVVGSEKKLWGYILTISYRNNTSYNFTYDDEEQLEQDKQSLWKK